MPALGRWSGADNPGARAESRKNHPPSDWLWSLGADGADRTKARTLVLPDQATDSAIEWTARL